MFDYNMMLLDGSVDIDDAVDASHVPAISTSRVTASGATVIDLGTGGTPAGGLSAVLLLPALTSSTDYVIAYLEVSDTLDMTGATSDVHEMGKFDIAAATTGRILASELTTAKAVVLRFATKERYVRLNIAPVAVGSVGNMGAIKCYLTPYAFNVL